MHDLKTRVEEYHRKLPGIVRALLTDHGISSAVIDRHQLGFDGEAITVPIRDTAGQVLLLERWDGEALGVPLDALGRVELFGAEVLENPPQEVFIAEGVFEALILESQGLPAVAASGTGRFFKAREWGALFAGVRRPVIALRRGEKTPRSRYLPSRADVAEEIARVLPRAMTLEWLPEVGRDGGAYAYFVTAVGTVENLRTFLVSP